MRIDTHTHIGKYEEWDCRAEELVALLKENKVSHAFVADMDGNEHGTARLDQFMQELKLYGDLFYALAFINPKDPKDLSRTAELIEKYPDRIVGIKIHPWTNKVRLSVDGYRTYLEYFKDRNIPFCVHTGQDSYSETEKLKDLALAYPTINFVAVHMDIQTNHETAIDTIAQIPNLYGDTSWVNPETVCEAIKKCGEDKILFGTDASVFRMKSYDRPKETITYLQQNLPQATVDKVMAENAIRLFHLDKAD